MIFIREQPFAPFVSSLVADRISHADPTNLNAPAERRAKDAMNSAIGRFSMNYEKQTKVNFIGIGKIWSHMRTPFFRNYTIMDAEGETEVALIEKRYRRKLDDLATHVSLFGNFYNTI